MARVGDRHVRMLVAGCGAPVLLLHGSPNSGIKAAWTGTLHDGVPWRENTISPKLHLMLEFGGL